MNAYIIINILFYLEYLSLLDIDRSSKYKNKYKDKLDMSYDRSFGSPFKGPNGMSLNDNDVSI